LLAAADLKGPILPAFLPLARGKKAGKIETPAEKQAQRIDYWLFSADYFRSHLCLFRIINNRFQGIYLQSLILAVLAVVPVIIVELAVRLRRLAFLPLIRWPPQERWRLTLPAEVILTLLVRPLWVFCFGIYPNPSKRTCLRGFPFCNL